MLLHLELISIVERERWEARALLGHPAAGRLSLISQRTRVLNSDGTKLDPLLASIRAKSVKEQIMDKKSTSVPGTNRASATTPEDLHVPEHEPPSMPEAADKPEAAAKDQVADLAVSAPAKVGGSVAPRATGVSASETEPEDLHVPEHEPPSMPEAADKPDKPAKDKSIGELR